MHLLSVLISAADAAVLLPFSKTLSSSPSIFKRSLGEWIQGDGLSYKVTFELGGQTINAQLDTGSSDIWVVASSACTDNSSASCDTPYDETKSPNYSANDTEFTIEYGDSTGASGNYASDVLEIDGQKVMNANFALATNATSTNVFGIGPKFSESCTRWRTSGDSVELNTDEGCTPYDNLPVQMKSQGLIQSAAYSIWLEKAVEGNGRLLFGGINTAAIMGPFSKVPMEKQVNNIHDDGTYSEYPGYTMANILLNGLDLTLNGQSTKLYSGAFPVLLDYGSTICSLPSSITSAIQKIFNTDSTFNVPCSTKYNGWLMFNFRGVKLRVNLNDFVRERYDSDNNPMGVCTLGMITNDDMNLMILGDNILSSMYVTLDYDNNEVGLGQAAPFSIDNVVDIKGELDAKRAPLYDHKFDHYNRQYNASS